MVWSGRRSNRSAMRQRDVAEFRAGELLQDVIISGRTFGLDVGRFLLC